MKASSRLLAFFLSFLLLFNYPLYVFAADTLVDEVAPVIVHSPPENNTLAADRDWVLVASVTDDRQLESVALFYRKPGLMPYTMIPMQKSGEGDVYSAVVAASMLAEGLEYYIQAKDRAGNTGLYGFSFSPVLVMPKINLEKSAEEPVDKAITRAFNSEKERPKEKSSGSKKWLWIGLGVLLVGAAASAGGGGGGSSGNETGDVDIIGPVP